MRIQELLENQDEHLYPQELWNELVQTLQGAEKRLQAEQQADTSYGIGGNLHQSSSGQVQLQKDYVQHGAYNSSIHWNYALKIGTNVKGRKALDHAVETYKQLVLIIKEAIENYGNVRLAGDHQDVMHVKVDDRKFSIMYDYGSNFCTVGIRVAQ